MNLRKFLPALLASALFVFGATAQADPIRGGVSLAGNGSPIGSANWFDSTGVTYTNPWVVITGNQSYASVPFGTAVTFAPTNLSWGNATGSGLSIAPGAAWSFSFGGDTYTLVGDFITNILRGSAGNDSISVTGTGVLTITGLHCGPGNNTALCAPTAGIWNYTAGFAGTQQNLSFSAGANRVPEPGTLALIGLALAGMAVVRIRKQA